jgi:hypothetical protein
LLAVEDSSTPNDLVSRLLRAFDRFFDQLHDRVLRPIILVGRTIAFGFILLLVGLATIIFTLIFAVRFLDIYAFAAHPWLTYAVLGATLVLAGSFVWRMRRPVRIRK